MVASVNVILGDAPVAPRIRKDRQQHAHVWNLLDIMDTSNPGLAERRKHPRFKYRLVNIPVTVLHPGGDRTRITVITRDLSAGGLGFVHTAFMHAETRCTFELPRLDGCTQIIPGKVVSCHHFEGLLHGIGVAFTDLINPYHYLRPHEQLAPRRPVVQHIDRQAMHVQELRLHIARAAAELDHVIDPPNLKLAIDICSDLVESASRMKCAQLVNVTRKALGDLKSRGSVAHAAPTLRKVVDCCRRIEDWFDSRTRAA